MPICKSFLNWSGGKDSALSLYYARQQADVAIETLMTNVYEHDGSIAMHGVAESLLDRQAAAIGLPLQKVLLPYQPANRVYEQRVGDMCRQLVTAGFTYSYYGDIFLEDLKAYREEQMKQHGLKAVFPLWKKDTRLLVREILELGFKAIVVCVDATKLDENFCGRLLDQSFVNDLPASVDPCGENGEFHTFVYDGPMFSSAVKFSIGAPFYKEMKAPGADASTMNHAPANPGFWYADLTP